jgi:hypothetical protein
VYYRLVQFSGGVFTLIPLVVVGIEAWVNAWLGKYIYCILERCTESEYMQLFSLIVKAHAVSFINL